MKGALRRGLLALALVAAAGCGHGARAKAQLAAPYHPQQTRGDTRILLVAGGDDVANFAEEVVSQRKLWRGAGVPREAIACYWAKPRGRAWAKDRRQYDKLARALASCGRASPATVLDDLAALAVTPPRLVYLYVTAHGVPALSQASGAWTLPPEERSWLAQPALALDGDPGLRVQDTAALLQARREGRPDAALVLTPATLHAALSRLPEDTRKIVVLQGCFSGGFVEGPHSLVGVPNTTVLTAAAADRPSFGCGSGTRTTFWGGALERVLGDHVGFGTTPAQLPWHAIFEQVERRVTRLERALGQKPSRPQYRSSVR
ncbi:MAG: C13 family peptidase [Nannocystaceae bacterium]|nr:C13 family peptidase [Nannocystaceae bacterium]